MAASNSSYRLDQETTYLIYRAGRLLRFEATAFFKKAGSEISPEQWGLLLRLREKDGQYLSELTDNVLNDHPNITRMVDGLERLGLVSRTRDTKDRRRSLIHLTGKGSVLVGKLVPLINREKERFFRGLSDNELASLKNVLKKIEENILKTDNLD